MARLKDTLQELGFEPKPLRVYTPEDFPRIHERLKAYWADGKFDRNKFLVDCGALTKEGAVCVQNFHYELRKDHSVPVCDEPVTLKKAWNLLSWYLPESKNYPKLDVRKEVQQLQGKMGFEVRPILDDENHHRVDRPDIPYHDEPF